MVGGSFVLLLWLRFHANLPVLNSTWLGPVGGNYTISPAGSDRSPFSGQRPPPSTQSPEPEPCSSSGRNAPGKMRPKLPSQVMPRFLLGPHHNWRALEKSFRLIPPPQSGGRCCLETLRQVPPSALRRASRAFS